MIGPASPRASIRSSRRRAPSFGGSRRLRLRASPRRSAARAAPSAPASRSRPSSTEPDDRCAQPLPEHRRDGPLEPGAGLDQARPAPRARPRRPPRRAWPRRRPAPRPGPPGARMPCCASASARSCIWVAWRSAAPTSSAARSERLERSLGRRPAPLGLLGLRRRRVALLGGVRAELLQLGLELGDPRRRWRPRPARSSSASSRSWRSPEGAAQVALGELEGLRPGPNALGRRPRLRQQLAVAAPPLLPGRDPLLDRRATRPHLLEALLDRVAGGADLGQLRLGGRQLLLLGAEVVGDDPRPKLVRLAARASPCARPPRPGASAAAGGSAPPARRPCARSRLSRVRSSLSWALWRRLRCLPSPAASSISRRRSRGFELTICSTLPWLITEWASRPMFVSASASTMSTRRQRAPFSRYSPSPLRSIRREIEISENSLAARPSVLSITTSTSAKRRGDWPIAAREDHVAHLLAAHGESGSARRAPRAPRR